MPAYTYKAMGNDTKPRKGVIDAPSPREAREKLREQGLLITRLSDRRGTSRGELRGEGLTNFTIQLSQLLEAGMPLYESLLALEEQYRDETCHRILASLCEAIKEGASLSHALGRHPASFDGLYCAMVAAGESSGALPLVLRRLAALLTRQGKTKKMLLTALIYPAVLALFCTLVLCVLLTFAIPAMENLLEGRKVNGFTSLVLSVSHFLTRDWPYYMPSLGLLIGFGWLQIRSAAMRARLRLIVLRLPLLKPIFIRAALSRFTRTLATLLQGGVPLIGALGLSRKVMNHPILEELIEKAEGRIVEGGSFSRELHRSPWVPKLLARMIAVGEESGDLAPMLNQVANIYEDELEKTLARLTALAQPVILLIMGAVIALVMLAVLLPLTDISSLAN